MGSKLTDEWGFFTPVPEVVIEATPELGTDAVWLFTFLRYKTHRRKGKAWPSYKQIRDASGWGKTRISNALKALEREGWLEKRKRFSQSTVYTLTRPPHVGVSSSPELGQLEGASSPAAGPQSSHNGTTVVPEQDPTQDLTTQDLKDPRQKKGRNSAQPLPIQIYRSVTHRTPPKRTWDMIVASVDGNVLEFARHLRWWTLSNHDPTNYHAVLDAFKNDARHRGYTMPSKAGDALDTGQSWLANRKAMSGRQDS